MLQRLLEFSKTPHFIHRQWQRHITDEILMSALAHLHPQRGKCVVVVSRSWLRKWFGMRCRELIIITYGHRLITCYFCDLSHFRGHGDDHFRLVQ